MKALRIIATVVLGGYFLAMALQLIGVSMDVLRELSGQTPYSVNAKAVFFPNLLVCTLCVLGIWLVWRRWSFSERKNA